VVTTVSFINNGNNNLFMNPINKYLCLGALVLSLSSCDTSETLKRGKGIVVSERYISGETVEGEDFFHGGKVVRDPEGDMHTMIVNLNDGRTFSYSSVSEDARIMDLRYNIGDSMDLPLNYFYLSPSSRNRVKVLEMNK